MLLDLLVVLDLVMVMVVLEVVVVVMVVVVVVVGLPTLSIPSLIESQSCKTLIQHLF